jgi:hypothetical protein
MPVAWEYPTVGGSTTVAVLAICNFSQADHNVPWWACRSPLT